MEIAGSAFEWLEFDAEGDLRETDAVARMQAIADRPEVTDLVVVSHGWNNDRPDALALYRRLWTNTANALTRKGVAPAKFGVIGLLWPAKAYDGRYDGGAELVRATGGTGAQAIGADAGDPEDAPPERLDEMLRQIAVLVEPDEYQGLADAARVAAASSDESAAFAFFQRAKEGLGFGRNEDDPELAQDAALFGKSETIDGANDLLSAFSGPKILDLEPGTGGAQNLGSVVRAVFSGPREGVVWALNKLSYYSMKKRAGAVGQGLANALADLDVQQPLRLHLAGHSFGGRLVTAAAAALPTLANIEFRSLTLLQAAYSHNGMTEGKGPFARVLGKPSGPISFTHTHNDLACTVAYPLASRLSGDTALALGDANDPYGAMGANGPQLTGDMLAADCNDVSFAPVPGKINRFLADSYVVTAPGTDAHNNVGNVQCGRLLAATITA